MIAPMRALLAASPAAVLSQDPMGGTIMLTGHKCYISENRPGADWYWELMDIDGAVVARGLADTRTAALNDVELAEQEIDCKLTAHTRFWLKHLELE